MASVTATWKWRAVRATRWGPKSRPAGGRVDLEDGPFIREAQKLLGTELYMPREPASPPGPPDS